MRTILRRAAAAAALALAGGAVPLLTAAPAAAAPQATSPAQYCHEQHATWTTWDGRTREAYWVPLQSTAGQQGQYLFPIESFPGCVSTVSAGLLDGWVRSDRISLPAARAQCAYLEQELGLSYPTLMRGTPVHNRTACARYLQGALAVLPPPADGPPVHG